MVPTKNGLIDEVIVKKYKEAHEEAIREANTEAGGAKINDPQDDK